MTQIATKDIKQELKEIASSITTEIRIDAAKELCVHPETINRYLRGNAPRQMFAKKLLTFLREQIGEA